MPHRSLLRWSRLHTLSLVAVLASCGSQDATVLTGESTLLPEEPANAGTGTVSLAFGTGELTLASLRYTVRDPSGRIVLDATADLSAASPSIEFDAPAGQRLSIALSGSTEAGVECSGEAEFDVRADATVVVSVDLACEASGRVAVTGTLHTPDTCPSVSLAPLAAPVAVGSSIELRAGATEGAAPTYAWAASGGALDSSLSAAARFTCTEPGPVTLTLTASLESCSSTASTLIDCAAPEGGACTDLGSTCHPVDPGTGPLHECHELGHAGDEAACAAGRSACIEACGSALCSELGSLCHAVDPGTGPLHECHELGHAGDAAACFERGRECFDLCTEARAEASTPVTLSFAARVGEEELACGRTYEAVGSSAVAAEVQDLRFFVSDVRLIDASGAEEPVLLDTRAPWQLPEVGLLDFEDGTGLCASGTPDTNPTLTGRVFPGEYVGVAFRVSVPEALNHDDPATLAAPLELGSMSWGWLLGYRFLRAEMAGTPTEEGAPAAALLHLGSTACTGNPQAGTVVCTNENRNEVRLSGYDPATSTIIADVGALFAGTDLGTESLCHSSGEPCAAPFESVGVDLDTGAALETQTFFRVE